MNFSLWHRISTPMRALTASVVAIVVLAGCGSETLVAPGTEVVGTGEAPCTPPQAVETVEIPLLIRANVYTPFCAVRDSQGEGPKRVAFPFRIVEFRTRIDVDAAWQDKRGHIVPRSR